MTVHISTLRLEGVYLGRDGHYTDETSPTYYLYKNQVWEYLWTSDCHPVDAEELIRELNLLIFRFKSEAVYQIDFLRIQTEEALVRRLEEVVAEGELCSSKT